MIAQLRIPIVQNAAGIYLRWWFNGWHYWLFTNNYEVVMQTAAADTMTQQVFSIISKIERPTKLTAQYAYSVALAAMEASQLAGFTGLLLAELVEQYEGGVWREVDITRKTHTIRDEEAPAYTLEFEVTRKDLPAMAAVYQKSQFLYIGDTLADMDDDEVVALTKQVNDIAEMKDRQCDFTAEFKVRKTRAMRSLFELSGEVGANTTFPYVVQAARLVIDGVEVVTAGKFVLNRSDGQYYYVAIYGGNKNFFTAIDNKKITDLLLPNADHTWTVENMADSNSGAINVDYLYPALEPSDDGGIIPLTDDGNRAEVYGAWIWPFCKARAIWDEIIATAGFTVKGTLPFEDVFNKLYLSIASRNVDYINTAPYLYYVHVLTTRIMAYSLLQLRWSWNDYSTVTAYVGDSVWRYGCMYTTKFAGTYKFAVTIWNNSGVPVHVYLYRGAVLAVELTNDGTYSTPLVRRYAGSFDAGEGEDYTFWCTYNNGCQKFMIEVTEITAANITLGSTVPMRHHLPDMSQTDFIKMICNLFGYVPDTNPRDNTIRFWNYQSLYDNIPRARDWSAYLSEADDETEFKFGDYAQTNYMRFKDSADVVKDRGTGVMQIDDATLPATKDVFVLPLAICDEVQVLTDVVLGRIAMNKYSAKDAGYEYEDSIDPRLVYCDFVPEGSPTKTFGFRNMLAGGYAVDVDNPRKASSAALGFGANTGAYGALAHMLTRTNLRRAKFNLPAYEVAGFKHDVPIYLSQYKAYFYVNKIQNYVCGKLCTIQMFKL